MQRWFLLASLLVAACRGGGGVPVERNTSTAGGTRFPGLFAGDRTLIYDVAAESSFWDDQDPTADAHGNVVSKSTTAMTCRLTVGGTAGLQTASIVCEGGGAGVTDVLARGYVTDGDRLWQVEGGFDLTDAATVEKIAATPPMLTRDQQPIDRQEQDPEEPRFGSSYRVQAAGDGWCVEESSWSGDESGWSWCLSAADGIVSATHYWAGGSSRDEHAELRRPVR